MTLTNFRKHINNYSYTILSWIIGGLLFGFDQAIIIAFCGLAIDTALIIKNRVKIPKDIKRKDPFSKMFSVWGYTAFGFSFGYLLIIWLGTNQENNGIMDYWIIFFSH